jgi:hypothetical protein
VVVQCGEVLVFPGGISGVAGSRNRWSSLARVTNHTLRFTFPNLLLGFGRRDGGIGHCYRLPLSLSLGGDSAGSLDRSSLYPYRRPLFLRLCPRCCLMCLLLACLAFSSLAFITAAPSISGLRNHPSICCCGFHTSVPSISRYRGMKISATCSEAG